MGKDAIIARFPDIKESDYYFQALFYVMQYLYEGELTGTIPNPRAGLADDFSVLLTGKWYRDNDFKFLFLQK
ncbi:MAG: hypothetical protein LBP80_06440 [Treponema sp.]|jgi:hypothetical protein|nr:hypothetical protein [Treponema sp.]